MTRQIPDRLVHETDHLALYPCLPLLPAGDPRWDRCRFGPGETTANHRGYSARWAIRDGRLFLEACGGTAATDDGPGWPARSEGPRRQICMLDIHEVDTAVPATWVSDDLVCPSAGQLDRAPDGFVPDHFRLFRIERGAVVADLTVPNAGRVEDTHFRGVEALLDAHVATASPSAAGPAAGPAAVRGLAAALRDPTGAGASGRLAGLLWQAGRPDLDVLVSSLAATGDPDVRRWIAYALARIGPDAARAIPALMRILPATEDPDVLRAVAYALAGIGAPAASTFAPLISVVEARCGSRAERQILLFVDQLRSAGEGSIGVLIAGLLAARRAGTQSRIAHVLGAMGTVAVRPLCTAFAAAEDDRQRAALARALGGVGRDAGPALGLLLDRLDHLRDDEARAIFAAAIASIGLRSPASLAPLRAALRSARDARALGRIADAIASLGGGAVDLLVREFEAARAPARVQIARALGGLGPAARPAVACLASAARSSGDGDLVRQAAEALRTIGAPADVLAAIRIAALRHAPHGRWAEDVLEEMASGVVLSQEAVRDLAALLAETGDGPSGRLMAKVLGAIGEAAAEPLLTALGTVRDPRRRLLVIHALGLIGAPAAAALDHVVAVLAAAQDDATRLQLVDDLRRIGRPDAKHVATLVGVLDRSSFLPVWWRLGLVLAECGAPAIAPLVELLERTRDDDRRRAVGNALAQIGTGAVSAAPALQNAMRAATDPRARHALAAALRHTAMRLV